MRRLVKSLMDRLRSNLDLKVLLLLFLPTTTTAIYLIVQRVIVFPIRTVPLTPIDRAVAFQPAWVLAYLSLYLMMPWGPLLTRSRADLYRYTFGTIVCFAIACAFFVLMPTAGPSPADNGSLPLYRLLTDIVQPFNAFPSLHAAFAVFAVLYAGYASRDSSRRRLRRALLVFAWCWVAIILYATLATKQHLFLDLIPGMVLGWLSLRLAIAWPIFTRSSHAHTICDAAHVGRGVE